MRRRGSALLFLGLWCVSCVGAIDGPTGGIDSDGTGGTAGAGGTPGGGPLAAAGAGGGAPAPGLAGGGRPVVRRLGRVELRNTLADLFGADADGVDLPALDDATTKLSSPPTDFIGATDMGKLDVVAKDIAERYVRRLQATAATKCAESAGQIAPCVDAFLTTQGSRIFRRPFRPHELERYRKVYGDGRARKGHDAGLAFALDVLLQSPHFLYRTELGEPAGQGKRKRLTDYEYASLLSYFVTRSAPDAALLGAAAAGRLRSGDVVRAELARLLASKRGQEEGGVLDFYNRWLGLDGFEGIEKNNLLFKAFTPAFRSSALREVTEVLKREILSGQGSFKNLLLTSKGYVDRLLAPVYGVPRPDPRIPEGDSVFAHTDLDPNIRKGIFTQVAFQMAVSEEQKANPFRAASLIFDDLLCQPIPAPPNGALDVPFTPDPMKSHRQNLEARTSMGTCAGCHTTLNPVAFTFEAYDPIGRHRTRELTVVPAMGTQPPRLVDGGFPIDASGELNATRDANGKFQNLPGLMTLLANSRQVSECHVSQWLEYALGRMDVPGDAPSLERAHEVFARSSFEVLSMLGELMLSDSVLYRTSI